jgi:hypothetical protein
MLLPPPAPRSSFDHRQSGGKAPSDRYKCFCGPSVGTGDGATGWKSSIDVDVMPRGMAVQRQPPKGVHDHPGTWGQSNHRQELSTPRSMADSVILAPPKPTKRGPTGLSGLRQACACAKGGRYQTARLSCESSEHVCRPATEHKWGVGGHWTFSATIERDGGRTAEGPARSPPLQGPTDGL